MPRLSKKQKTIVSLLLVSLIVVSIVSILYLGNYFYLQLSLISTNNLEGASISTLEFDTHISSLVIMQWFSKYEYTYLKGAIPQVPANYHLSKAILKLQCSEVQNPNSNEVNYTVWRVTSSWNVATITWNTSPSNTFAPTTNVVLTPTSTFIGQYLVFDVTKDVQLYIDNVWNILFGWVIKPNTISEPQTGDFTNAITMVNPILEFTYEENPKYTLSCSVNINQPLILISGEANYRVSYSNQFYNNTQLQVMAKPSWTDTEGIIYTFSHWLINRVTKEPSASYLFNITQTTDIIAVYLKEGTTFSTVTISITGKGITSPSSGLYLDTYLVGSDITLYVQPSVGYKLDHINRNSIPISGTDIISLTATENIEVVFVEQSITDKYGLYIIGGVVVTVAVVVLLIKFKPKIRRERIVGKVRY